MWMKWWLSEWGWGYFDPSWTLCRDGALLPMKYPTKSNSSNLEGNKSFSDLYEYHQPSKIFSTRILTNVFSENNLHLKISYFTIFNDGIVPLQIHEMFGYASILGKINLFPSSDRRFELWKITGMKKMISQCQRARHWRQQRSTHHEYFMMIQIFQKHCNTLKRYIKHCLFVPLTLNDFCVARFHSRISHYQVMSKSHILVFITSFTMKCIVNSPFAKIF